MSARALRPRATTPQHPGATSVDREDVEFHAERIQAAAKVLDDVQRAHIYVGEDETVQQEVLRDALTLLLLEESAALVTTVRGRDDGKVKESFDLSVKQAAERLGIAPAVMEAW